MNLWDLHLSLVKESVLSARAVLSVLLLPAKVVR